MEDMTFNNAQAERLIGMPYGTLKTVIRQGFCRHQGGVGKWTRRQVTAIAVMRAARRQGATLVAAVAAYDILVNMKAEILQGHAAAGRKYLVLLGEMAILRPVSRERAYDDDLREQAIRNHLPLVIVDLEQVDAAMSQAIQEMKDNPGENCPGRKRLAPVGRPMIAN